MRKETGYNAWMMLARHEWKTDGKGGCGGRVGGVDVWWVKWHDFQVDDVAARRNVA